MYVVLWLIVLHSILVIWIYIILQNEGYIALRTAIKRYEVEIVRILLDKGAKVERKSKVIHLRYFIRILADVTLCTIFIHEYSSTNTSILN